MKKTYAGIDGNEFEAEFTEHDISTYDVLFHVTTKERKSQIEEVGLLLNQEPNWQPFIKTEMLFVSYPIDMNTSDCFRWYDDTCTLVILDAKKLLEDGYIFYDDFWGGVDASSKRNHLCINKDIPKEYIKKIVEF